MNTTAPPKTMRRFVFTLNNPTELEYESVIALPFQWLIVAKETGANGTPHLQGAAVIGKCMRFDAVKRMIPRAHIEPMKGTPQDSLKYCSKQDPNPFQKGELPAPGKRNDLLAITQEIRDGKTLRDLVDDFGPEIVKYHKGLQFYRSLCLKPRDIDIEPKVYWLYGTTGTRKTRSAYELAKSLGYGLSDIWQSNDDLKWFDGYDGQSYVILDDFRPNQISFAFLLRVTDRYPLRVQFKGGYHQWLPLIIIITSPHNIVTTFATRNEHRPEDIGQFTRRVSAELNFPDAVPTFLGLEPELKEFISSVTKST